MGPLPKEHRPDQANALKPEKLGSLEATLSETGTDQNNTNLAKKKLNGVCKGLIDVVSNEKAFESQDPTPIWSPSNSFSIA